MENAKNPQLSSLRPRLQAARASSASLPYSYAGLDHKNYAEMLTYGVIDTKEKPFICSCGAAFTRTDLLRRHEKLTHLAAAEPEDGLLGGSSAATFPETNPLQDSIEEIPLAELLYKFRGCLTGNIAR